MAEARSNPPTATALAESIRVLRQDTKEARNVTEMSVRRRLPCSLRPGNSGWGAMKWPGFRPGSLRVHARCRRGYPCCPSGALLLALSASNGDLLWSFNTLLKADPNVRAAGGAGTPPLVGRDGSVTFGVGNPYQSVASAILNPSQLLYSGQCGGSGCGHRKVALVLPSRAR